MRWTLPLCRLTCGVFLVATLSRERLSVAAAPQDNPQKGSEIGTVKSILDGMQGAGMRLKVGDTGAGTRQIQEKVVNDIQKLIDAAKPKPSNANSQQNSGSRQQSGSQPQSPQPQSQQSPGQQGETGSQPAGSGKAGRKSGMGKPFPSERGAAHQHQPLFREVWGHLPPALRERTPSDFHEAILPAYDDLVRRYFEALLDGASSTPNRPVPGQTSTPERSPELPAQ